MATLGLPGGLDRAKPIISAMAAGYSTRITTSSGERRRIWMSLTSSQRTSMTPGPQEADECALEVGRLLAARRGGQLGRGAQEQHLSVTQDQNAVGVSIGL